MAHNTTQIWVTGVSGLVRERAAACVTRAGGVRYSAAHERVTHVVAGSRAAAEAARALLPHVPALAPLWLLRSVRAKRVLDEAEVNTAASNTFCKRYYLFSG